MAQFVRAATLPILLLATVGLGYLNWHVSQLAFDETSASTPRAARPVAVAAVVASNAVLPTVADYPQTTRRPLFFADRRMPEKPKPKPPVVVQRAPVVEAKPAPLPNLEPLVLIGIKRDNVGQKSQILVRTTAETQGIWLSVGDQFRGWSVQEVANDHAILEGRGQRSELRLYSQSTSRPIQTSDAPKSSIRQ